MGRGRHSSNSSGVPAILQPPENQELSFLKQQGLALALAFHQLFVLLAPWGDTGGSALSPVRNLVVVAILPAGLFLLALRSGGKLPDGLLPRGLAASFAALLGYAALASLWSDEFTAAMKAVVYLAAFGCVFRAHLALLRDRSALLPGYVAGSVLALLVVGTAQTFLARNPFGELAYRFTAFGAPQPYALALATMTGLLLVHARRGALHPVPAVIVLGTAIVGLVLCGGRQAFVAAIGLVVLSCWPGRGQARRAFLLIPLGALAAATFFGLSLRGAGPTAVADMLAAHPPAQLLFLAEADLQASGDAGTARARAEIFRALWQRIRASTATQLAFGHGTSTSGVVIAEGDVRYREYDAESLDPNRTAHNEFLRSLYEWGVVGLLLFGALVSIPTWIAVATVRRTGATADLLLAACAGIAFLGFSLLGNSLAAMSGPLGPALSLLCAEVVVNSRGDAA